MRALVGVFLTLRGRLILLICFATVPALLFIFYLASREREAALTRMETEARHLGGLASREHAQQINGARNLLARLSLQLACDRIGQAPIVPPGASRLAAACPEYLPTLLSGFPQFANIGVADPGGDVVCSAAPIATPARLQQNQAFTRALDSRAIETGTYVMGFIGRPVLHLATALRRSDGVVCAVPFVAVELGWLDQLAAQTNLPADYSLLITDRTGRVLAQAGAAIPGLPSSGQPVAALAETLGRARGEVMDVGAPAVARYIVATPMEGIPGVFVVAVLPFARIQETTNQAFYRTLAGLILVTIFAITAAIVAAEFSVLRDLRGLTRAVRRFGTGDLTARAPLPASHGELRELALAFGSMADALEARQREAEEGRTRLRALSHRLQTTRDVEAGRIARELHDELGQVLTGLKMQLSMLRRRAPANADDGTPTDEALTRMVGQIDAAIDTVRRISSELRPPVLDRLGLADAIDWLVRDSRERSGLEIAYDAVNVNGPIDSDVATTAFRIVQEALTNVIRHSGATRARVELTGRAETLALMVADNGRGIAQAEIDGMQALGILGMRERVHLLGGSWRIRGVPGCGTTIDAELPRVAPQTVEAGAAPDSRS